MIGPGERFAGVRGQTLPDFAVGIAVFLIAVTFVSMFVPQLAAPFEEQEQSVVADRITNGLGGEVLVDRDAPSRLNESSTRTFFDRDEADALHRLGIAPRYSLNVTVRDAPTTDSDSEILCAVDDPSDGEWIDECESGDDRLSIGGPVTDDRSVSTGRRSLFVGDRDVVLEVRVH